MKKGLDLKKMKLFYPGLYQELKKPSNATNCPDIMEHGYIIYEIDGLNVSYCKCAPVKNHKVVAAGINEKTTGFDLEKEREKSKKLSWLTTMNETLWDIDPEKL